MNVQDLITELQLGDLSELAIGDSELTSTYLPTFLSAIQAGLTQLHTRFLLRQKSLVIQPIEGMTQYDLSFDYALTNPEANPVYILDSVYDPFNWHNLQILAVHDEEGHELPLNNSHFMDGVFSTTATDILIPMNITARQIFLSCRADHVKLTGLDSKISLPAGLQKALVFFVASKIWGTKKDADSIQKSVQYSQQYSDLISVAVDQGTAVTMDTITFNTHDRGWR